MSTSRRDFLAFSALGMVGSALPIEAQAASGEAQELPPGAPPAFGTAPPVGP